MLRHDVCCTGEESKAWTPADGGGPFGQPCAALSVAGEVHHGVVSHL